MSSFHDNQTGDYSGLIHDLCNSVQEEYCLLGFDLPVVTTVVTNRQDVLADLSLRIDGRRIIAITDMNSDNTDCHAVRQFEVPCDLLLMPTMS